MPITKHIEKCDCIARLCHPKLCLCSDSNKQVETHTCYQRLWRLEEGDSGIQSYRSPYSKFKASMGWMRLCF